MSDLISHDDFYLIYLDVPDMLTDEIDIVPSNEEVRISGNRKKEHDNLHYNLIRRKFGEFNLSFKIPPRYNKMFDSVQLDDGVLVIRFDKAVMPINHWSKRNRR